MLCRRAHMQVFATYPLTYKQNFNMQPTELLLSVSNCKARPDDRRARMITNRVTKMKIARRKLGCPFCSILLPLPPTPYIPHSPLLKDAINMHACGAGRAGRCLPKRRDLRLVRRRIRHSHSQQPGAGSGASIPRTCFSTIQHTQQRCIRADTYLQLPPLPV